MTPAEASPVHPAAPSVPAHPVAGFLATHAAGIEVIETHMSLVFMTRDRVYKMKKPIRLRFLDLRTLEARRRSCERETEINQRLAPGVYLGTLAVTRDPGGGFELGGAGEAVEWLVVMKRLDRAQQLDERLRHGEACADDIDRLCGVLSDFYGETARIGIGATEWLARWRRNIDHAEATLSAPEFALPRETVATVIAAQRDFLRTRSGLLAARADEGRIRDGHGDLRPEHVYLGPPLLIIDRPEFDDRVRWVDPFMEAALLGVECARLGAWWVGEQLVAGLADRLRDRPAAALVRFYYCHEACLRALLSIEHLHDPVPRTPERWPQQACDYLDIARRMLPLDQS